MKAHELKTDSKVFQAVADEEKTFEIRLNDREFKQYDILILRETVFTGEAMKVGAPLEYTGECLMVDVEYILFGPIYGLKKGWVVMSIRPYTDYIINHVEDQSIKTN